MKRVREIALIKLLATPVVIAIAAMIALQSFRRPASHWQGIRILAASIIGFSSNIISARVIKPINKLSSESAASFSVSKKFNWMPFEHMDVPPARYGGKFIFDSTSNNDYKSSMMKLWVGEVQVLRAAKAERSDFVEITHLIQLMEAS